VVSHLLAEIETQAGRVLILRDGVCVADTTPGGLIDDAEVPPGGTAPLEAAYLAFLAGLAAEPWGDT
jgi:ABC-type multidrug transport system ATPase subunit